MEEYIKKLLEQVRFEKAHKAIGDEIRAHIEDQIEANVLDGMDRESAERLAVEDMGDPADVGVSLDKVHRPRVAWGVIVFAMIVATLGSAVRIFMAHDAVIRGHYDSFDKRVFIICTVLGIALMILFYFIDFTTVAKCSRPAGIALIVFLVISRFFNIYTNVADAINVLIVPLYAGIIYNYRGEKDKGFIKALLWIGITGGVLYYDNSGMTAFLPALALVVQLSIAIKKKWINVPNRPAIISLWSVFIPLFTFYVYCICNAAKSVTGVTKEKTRALVESAKMVGRSNLHPVTWSPSNASVITYIFGRMGIFTGITVILTVSVLIIIGFIAVFKSKNQLGLVMGSGCMVWLASNAVMDSMIGFGFSPDFGDSTFLPFVSGSSGHYKDLIAAYAMLGILLSIYKFKDVYPQHVDIGFRIKK
ncbi:MAG: hypothetical protein IKQ00_02800 [Butyrivibrio sp.]|nr:hypothetical protein [Butyrivibrio sp.]